MTLLAPEIAYCKECGEPFCQTRSDREFCGEAHRKIFNTRRIQGGLKLYDLAMRWRIERPKDAWGDLTTEVDRLAYDERERRRKRKEIVERHKAALRQRAAAE
jgi:hypothetical protein